jgi:predicted DsbA family dithiol-disulfide isomerase
MPVAELFRTEPAKIEAYMTSLKARAADLGLSFSPSPYVYNTRRAQELSLWAESRGRAEAFHKAVFRACLVEGKNIAEREVLLSLAESVGLPRSDAEQALADPSWKEAVDRDWTDAARQNVRAVPTIFYKGQRLVGFQPYEKLSRLIRGEIL